ncbi:Hypothetical protein R9X50_00797400 [Acrodontium crateriforme]|uniref:Zn(2)-C6 fungal-type domain-containing protein n=1 Tax=Acrodontium crateriforme TaxID=150365 RepID=A0AAQ3MC56_9PEZI|nr:Hypothetical protein R9X50_00797400 [Acrodontium crateriforme]
MDADSTGSGSVEPGSATKQRHSEKDKRTSRACLTCRKRKSACHLPIVDGQVTTPCQRCKATGAECIIGSSNRGGKRVRKRTADQAGFNDSSASLPPPTPSALETLAGAIDFDQEQYASLRSRSTAEYYVDSGVSVDRGPGLPIPSPGPGMFLDPALRAAERFKDGNSLEATRESSTASNTNIAFSELQNPSDALGILAQIASDGENAHIYPSMQSNLDHRDSNFTLEYPLVRDGKLLPSKVINLLQRYKHYYHPYFPIVPRETLDAGNLAKTALEEHHLLTAILVIASRDLTDEPNIFAACAEHMRMLVSALAAGGPGNVEAVEALLLLAEWTPYTSRSDAGHVGRGEEDREAWMHVGTALRIAYFLGLDRYSFAVRGDDVKDPQWQRKRLVWTACYISDRQISIRLGRAFWSRGPGPLTNLRREDFPMLQATMAGEEDFASIFQATLELTLLFSNVHDVLYANPGNSMRSHLSGGYIKYIDDFRSALYSWKSVWQALTCSPNLKATLLMSYDYLRLYTNAFAFHATVKRAITSNSSGGQTTQTASKTSVQRVFYNNVGAVGDARFIYEGLDAAKGILSMCNTFVDPEKMLRFMPLRFYLYCVYSAVFLYRARCAGVLAADEENSVRQMVQETVGRLERSGLGSQHPGSRYAQLVKLLWDKVDRKQRKGHEARGSTATLTNPYRPGSVGGPTPTPNSSSTAQHESPAVTEMMGDFSWTDLDAIGNFAVNGNGGNVSAADSEWWSGFLPADSGNFLFDGLPGMDGWDLGLQ